MEYPMDQLWDELDQLGQKIAVLDRLLSRAMEYGDELQRKRFKAEIGKAEARRHNILMSIAGGAVAA